jgi:hypothetical protein
MYFLPCSDGCVYGTDFTLSFWKPIIP